MNEYKQTLGKNWELTTGVVQWRKQPKLDCIDPLSRIIIILEERERDEFFRVFPPTLKSREDSRRTHRKTEHREGVERQKWKRGRDNRSLFLFPYKNFFFFFRLRKK